MGGHHSARAGTAEWLTPPGILAALGPFDLDPCAPIARPWPMATTHYTVEHDGLSKPWHGRVWCNPPYGAETAQWLARLAMHGDGIALIFARVETAAWADHVWPKADAILFVAGRLHFCYPDGSRAAANAGAPSALIAYGLSNAATLRTCGIRGAWVPFYR